MNDVNDVWIGADFDDGWVAYINGTEVARSAQMPAGFPAWNADPSSHESSNGIVPDYGDLIHGVPSDLAPETLDLMVTNTRLATFAAARAPGP